MKDNNELMKRDVDSLQKAQAYIAAHKKDAAESPLRQKYHFMPEYGWMNDPNGLVIFEGKYHLFYQHNPYAPKHGAMHWGHAVSEDCLSWDYQPIALAPTQSYEFGKPGGCYSGTAIVHDNTLSLMYTGAASNEGVDIQTQCLASYDGHSFIKDTANPVAIVPEHYDSANFRDPKIWRHSEYFYMLCASRINNHGCLLLFRSSDLHNWSFMGQLLGEYDSLGQMWECPDFFSIGKKDVIVFSVVRSSSPYSLYFIGKLDYETCTFSVDRVQPVDYGPDYYAPQTFANSEDIIQMAWCNSWEWSGQWESFGQTQEHGWCGHMSIPRVLHLTSDNFIYAVPINSIQSRKKPYMSRNTVKVKNEPELLFTNDCSSFEVSITFKQSDIIGDDVSFLFRGDSIHGLGIKFDFTTNTIEFSRNYSYCSKTVLGHAPFSWECDGSFSFKILFDTTSAEVFLGTGINVFTVNLFPSPSENVNCVFAKEGTTISSLTVEELL